MNVLQKGVSALTKSKNLVNSYWIIGEQLLQMLVSMIILFFSARYLGPSNFGALNYTASFVTFFIAIATLSMEGVTIKKMIFKPNDEGAYLGSCMLFRFISSIASIIAVTLIVYVLNPDDSLKVVLVLLQSFQLTFRSVHILDAWFQRHLKSKYVSIAKMAAFLAVSSYKIYLLVAAKSILWFALVTSLSDLILAILLLIFYRYQKGPRMSVDFKLGFEVLGESYHFIISGIMISLYMQMDRIMIGKMLSDTEVGLFTAATMICSAWCFVPSAIITSFRPMIMELKKSGDEELYLRRLKQLFSAIVVICALASVCISIPAKWIVYFLFGSDYLSAVTTLRISIWSGIFAMMGCIRGVWVVTENKNRYVKYYLSVGCVANFILNFTLIPIWGINGAAFATLITHILADVFAPAFFKETKLITKIALQGMFFEWAYGRKKQNGKAA